MKSLNTAGVACLWTLAIACACSSNIAFGPSDADAGVVERPNLPQAGTGGTGVSVPGSGGTGAVGVGGSGEAPPPDMLQQGGTGGTAVVENNDDAGPVRCPDADADGVCDTDDACPSVANAATTDRDQDGKPDACDACPDVTNQDDAADIDQDGIPDACDPCGISVALALSPMFYFPLDEGALAGQATNFGSVNQSGTYTGPVTRGLPGVADPAGRAVLMAGSQNGQFSRVTLLNALQFPSTSLTAMFWVRTTQTTDYSIFSYALANSSNEFGVIVEGDSIRITLQNSTFESGNIFASDLADGTWHFVAITWEQTVANIYFDGVLAGPPVQTSAGFEITTPGSVPVTGPLVLSPGGVLVLGQDQDGLNTGFSATQSLTGGLDEVAIYDRSLSNAELQTIFRATTCNESCDGRDNDGDGRVDEGFLGSSPNCAAASCQAISDAGQAFGTGSYFLTTNPGVATTCAF